MTCKLIKLFMGDIQKAALSLGAVSVLITTLLALSGKVDAGYAGLTITSAMSFTNGIYWTCRQGF